jgi:hypothetical protein
VTTQSETEHAPMLVTAVKVGDRITERDTPAGPFYAVLRVSRASLVVETATADESANGETYLLTVRISSGGSVLVARQAELSAPPASTTDGPGRCSEHRTEALIPTLCERNCDP